MLNAYSRYFAPARPMALGTRALNGRKLIDVYAGLPRDLNTRLPIKTFAKLRAVFCPKVTTNTAPQHRTQERRSQAFNAELSGALVMEAKPQ